MEAVWVISNGCAKFSSPQIIHIIEKGFLDMLKDLVLVNTEDKGTQILVQGTKELLNNMESRKNPFFRRFITMLESVGFVEKIKQLYALRSPKFKTSMVYYERVFKLEDDTSKGGKMEEMDIEKQNGDLPDDEGEEEVDEAYEGEGDEEDEGEDDVDKPTSEGGEKETDQ